MQAATVGFQAKANAEFNSHLMYHFTSKMKELINEISGEMFVGKQ